MVDLNLRTRRLELGRLLVSPRRKLGLFGSSCHTVGDSRLTRGGTTHSRDLSRRGAARAEDAQGTPSQSHISPSILVYDDLG
jgi:hypothetical protein